MAGSKSKTNKYGVEVVTYHFVTIEWVWKASHEDNYAYTEKVHDNIDSHWSNVAAQFPGVKRMSETPNMGLHYWKRVTLRGDNSQMVFAAGQSVAKAIFAHRFVEPIVKSK